MSLKVYVLQQVVGPQEVASLRDQMRAAIDAPGVDGSSWRMPWTSVSDQLLAAIAEAAGPKPFAVRFMAGRHTPPASMGRTFVYNGAETGGQGAGSRIPVPFDLNGHANITFESAWKALVTRLIDWSVLHSCPVLHCGWPGLLWAELALVAQEQALAGYSMDAVAAAHIRLLSFAASQAAMASPDLTIEFPISGHCPQELRTRITNAVKADPDLKARVMIQSNNLDSTGAGIPKPGDMRRGLQMVGGVSYDWPKVFQTAAGFESLEVYLSSFAAPGADQLRVEIARSSEDELARLRTLLASLQALRAAKQVEIGDAQGIVEALEADALSLDHQIAAVQEQIEALDIT